MTRLRQDYGGQAAPLSKADLAAIRKLCEADISSLPLGSAEYHMEELAVNTERLLDELERTREALRPFAVIGAAVRASTTDSRWLETPLFHALFHAGTDADPQSMTLTGRAFDNARTALPPEEPTNG